MSSRPFDVIGHALAAGHRLWVSEDPELRRDQPSVFQSALREASHIADLLEATETALKERNSRLDRIERFARGDYSAMEATS